MNVGDIYYWENEVPRVMRDVKWRYFKVLSITLTHVYVRNMKTGLQQNKSIDDFEENYRLIERVED